MVIQWRMFHNQGCCNSHIKDQGQKCLKQNTDTFGNGQKKTFHHLLKDALLKKPVFIREWNRNGVWNKRFLPRPLCVHYGSDGIYGKSPDRKITAELSECKTSILANENEKGRSYSNATPRLHQRKGALICSIRV